MFRVFSVDLLFFCEFLVLLEVISFLERLLKLSFCIGVMVLSVCDIFFLLVSFLFLLLSLIFFLYSFLGLSLCFLSPSFIFFDILINKVVQACYENQDTDLPIACK